MTHTRDTSIATLETCLGEFAADHDLPAIADALFWEVETWDVTKVDGETFWQTVEAHPKPSAQPPHLTFRADVVRAAAASHGLATDAEIAAALPLSRAARVGVSRRFLCGRDFPSSEALAAFCTAFGLTLDDMITINPGYDQQGRPHGPLGATETP